MRGGGEGKREGQREREWEEYELRMKDVMSERKVRDRRRGKKKEL